MQALPNTAGVFAMAATIACLAGCQSIVSSDAVDSDDLLRAARSSPDAVTLDIYWADLPPGGERAEADLWRFVQEDRLDGELRRRLADHGLRAGVVGGAPPTEIVRLLDPQGRHVGENGSETGADEAPVLTESTGVSRKTIQIRPGRPLEIKATETLEAAPLLAADGRSAEVLHGAQAFYSLEVSRRPGGGYTVEMTPELQSGEARWGWTPDETGMLARQKPLRDKRVFADLGVEAPLVVGEMLIVTARHDAANGLLGRYLHGAGGDPHEASRAILVRLTHAPPDPAFDFEGRGEVAAID